MDTDTYARKALLQMKSFGYDVERVAGDPLFGTCLVADRTVTGSVRVSGIDLSYSRGLAKLLSTIEGKKMSVEEGERLLRKHALLKTPGESRFLTLHVDDGSEFGPTKFSYYGASILPVEEGEIYSVRGYGFTPCSTAASYVADAILDVSGAQPSAIVSLKNIFGDLTELKRPPMSLLTISKDGEELFCEPRMFAEMERRKEQRMTQGLSQGFSFDEVYADPAKLLERPRQLSFERIADTIEKMMQVN